MVFMATATKQEAQKIVRSLLGKHFIACANIIGPVNSEFWWQGKIDKAREFLVLMKSDEKLFEKLSKTVKDIHSYEIPEILAIPIVRCSATYLEWSNSTLSQAER